MGEAFEAYHGALNIDRFGWIWAGVQDEATSADRAAHPYLYVHHANFGLYLSYALRRLGLTSLELQNAVSGIGSALGLVVAFVCLCRLTASAAFATLVLYLLALDFVFISDWSFNIHRAFTYLSVFGAILLFFEASRRDFRHAGWTVAAFLSCFLLIGTDYLYFLYTGFVIVALAAIYSDRWRQSVANVCVVVLVFALVFAARQAQIAAGVGLAAWSTDFVFQVLNRLHLESFFPSDWSRSTADFYAQQPIYNPGFSRPISPLGSGYEFLISSGAAYLRSILGFREPTRLASLMVSIGFAGLASGIVLLQVMGRQTWATRLSLLGMIITLAGVVAAAAVNFGLPMNFGLLLIILLGMLGAFCAYGLRLWPASDDVATSSDARPVVLGVVMFAACVVLACVMPAYFAGWYRAFQIAAVCIFVWFAVLAIPFINSGVFRRNASAFIAVVLLAKAISLASVFSGPQARGGDHAMALRALRGVPTASNFTPASVASYTEAFSAFAKPEAAQRLLTEGRIPVTDYYMFYERDGANPAYERPKYFVFYKGLTIFGGDWSFLSAFKPVAEGNDYAIYAVPATSVEQGSVQP
jgi:hypothetical protein